QHSVSVSTKKARVIHEATSASVIWPMGVFGSAANRGGTPIHPSQRQVVGPAVGAVLPPPQDAPWRPDLGPFSARALRSTAKRCFDRAIFAWLSRAQSALVRLMSST